MLVLVCGVGKQVILRLTQSSRADTRTELGNNFLRLSQPCTAHTAKVTSMYLGNSIGRFGGVLGERGDQDPSFGKFPEFGFGKLGDDQHMR